MRPAIPALSRPDRAPHATVMNPGLRKALPRAEFSRPVGSPIHGFRMAPRSTLGAVPTSSASIITPSSRSDPPALTASWAPRMTSRDAAATARPHETPGSIPRPSPAPLSPRPNRDKERMHAPHARKRQEHQPAENRHPQGSESRNHRGILIQLLQAHPLPDHAPCDGPEAHRTGDQDASPPDLTLLLVPEGPWNDRVNGADEEGEHQEGIPQHQRHDRKKRRARTDA